MSVSAHSTCSPHHSGLNVLPNSGCQVPLCAQYVENHSFTKDMVWWCRKVTSVCNHVENSSLTSFITLWCIIGRWQQMKRPIVGSIKESTQLQQRSDCFYTFWMWKCYVLQQKILHYGAEVQQQSVLNVSKVDPHYAGGEKKSVLYPHI